MSEPLTRMGIRLSRSAFDEMNAQIKADKDVADKLNTPQALMQGSLYLYQQGFDLDAWRKGDDPLRHDGWRNAPTWSMK